MVGDPKMVRKSAARSHAYANGAGPCSRAGKRRPNHQQRNRDFTESGWLLCPRSNLQRVLPSDESVLTQSRAYRESHPLEPEPSPYVGEARCAQCHADIASAHHKSRHSSTFYRANELPTRSPFRTASSPIRAMTKSRPCISQKVGNARHPEVETNVNGAIQQTIIDYAFGSGLGSRIDAGWAQPRRPVSPSGTGSLIIPNA